MDSIVCKVPLSGKKEISEQEWRNRLGCDIMFLDISSLAAQGDQGATLQGINPSHEKNQDKTNALQRLQPADVIFSRPIEMIYHDGIDFQDRLRRMAESPLTCTELFCTIAVPVAVAALTHNASLGMKVRVAASVPILRSIWRLLNPTDDTIIESMADFEARIKKLECKDTKREDINAELIRIVSAEVEKTNVVVPETSKQAMARRYAIASEMIEIADHIHGLVGEFLPPKLRTISKKAITASGLIVQTATNILDVNPVNPMSYVKVFVGVCRCGKSFLSLFYNDSGIDPAEALRAELGPIFDAIEKQNKSVVNHLSHIDGVLRTMQTNMVEEFAHVYKAMEDNFLTLSNSLDELSRQIQYVDSKVCAMIKSETHSLQVKFLVMHDEMTSAFGKTDTHMDKYLEMAAHFCSRLWKREKEVKADIGNNLFPLAEPIGRCIGTLTVKIEKLTGVVLAENPINGELWALLCKHLIEYLIQLKISHPESAKDSTHHIRRTLEGVIGMGQEHIKFIRSIRAPATLRAVVNDYDAKLNRVLGVPNEAILSQSWNELHESEMLLRRYLDASMEGLSSTVLAVICRPPLLFRSTLELRKCIDESVALKPPRKQYTRLRFLQEQSDTLRLLLGTLSSLHEFCNESPLQFLSETDQMLNVLMSMHISYSDSDQVSYHEHFATVRTIPNLLPVPSHTFQLSAHNDFRFAMKLSALDAATQQSLIGTLESYVNHEAAFHFSLDELGRNTFLVACASGCSYTVGRLLKCNEKGEKDATLVEQLNSRDILGNTALHLSAQSGNMDALNLLIQHYGYGAFYGRNFNAENQRPIQLLPEHCIPLLALQEHLLEAQSAVATAKANLFQAECALEALQTAKAECAADIAKLYEQYKRDNAALLKLHPRSNVAKKNTVLDAKRKIIFDKNTVAQKAIYKRQSSIVSQLPSASAEQVALLRAVHNNAQDCVNSIMMVLPKV